jgi:hypothetical protein
VCDYAKEHNFLPVPQEDYLDIVPEEKGIPAPETPELPEQYRVTMMKKCHTEENEVIKNTAIRKYKRIPMAEFIIRHFFSVNLFEKLFFKILVFRRIFE